MLLPQPSQQHDGSVWLSGDAVHRLCPALSSVEEVLDAVHVKGQ